MLEWAIFDTVANFTSSTFPEAYNNGTVELIGAAVLAILLTMTTGAHPWLIVPNLAAV